MGGKAIQADLEDADESLGSAFIFTGKLFLLYTEKKNTRCDNMMSSWLHSHYIMAQIRYYFLPVRLT